MCVSSLIPSDAEKIKGLTKYSYDNSKNGCLNAHLRAPISTLGAGAISLGNTPIYFVKGTLSFAWGVISCNRNSHLATARKEYCAAVKSLAFAAISIALFVLGLLAPGKVFVCFEYQREKRKNQPPRLPACDTLTQKPKPLEQQNRQEQAKTSPPKGSPMISQQTPSSSLSQPLLSTPDTSKGDQPGRNDDIKPPAESDVVLHTSQAPHLVGQSPTPSAPPAPHLVKQAAAATRSDNLPHLSQQYASYTPENQGVEGQGLLDRAKEVAIPAAANGIGSVAAGFVKPTVTAAGAAAASMIVGPTAGVLAGALAGAAVGSKVAGGVSSTMLDMFNDNPQESLKLKKYHVYMEQLKGLFSDYLDRNSTSLLQQQDGNELHNKYRELLKTLNDTQMDPRERYQGFCAQLDTLISTEEYRRRPSDDQIVKNIREICYFRWAGIKSTGYFEEIVLQATELDKSNLGRPEQFIENLLQLNGRIAKGLGENGKSGAALAKQKFSGAIGAMDYAGMQNTPNVRSVQVWQSGRDKRVVLNLRHACPTKPGKSRVGRAGNIAWVAGAFAARVVSGGNFAISTGEVISPNYREFIKDCLDRKQAIFYTCLQKNWAQAVESEQTRVQTLIQEQDQHDNFFVLVQAMNGNLYARKGEFFQITTFRGLKEALCGEFAKKYSGHVLPKLITANAENKAFYMEKMMPWLFNQVHTVFFSNNENIRNKEEWTSFILLCYLFQRHDMQFRLENYSRIPVTIKTNPCKDYLDRGGITALVESMVHALIHGKLQDAKWMYHEALNVLGPPIAVKKQGIIEERLESVMHLHGMLFEIANNAERLQEFRDLFQFGVNKQSMWRIASEEHQWEPGVAAEVSERKSDN